MFLQAELIRKPSLARFPISCSLDFTSKLQGAQTVLLSNQVCQQYYYCGAFCTGEESFTRTRGKEGHSELNTLFKVTWLQHSNQKQNEQTKNKKTQISLSVFTYLFIFMFMCVPASLYVHLVCAGAVGD